MDSSPVSPSEPSKAEAIASLRRALTIEPTDRQTAYALFNLELKSGHGASAEEALAHLQTHFPGPQTMAAEAHLRCAQGHPEEALDLVRELCFSPAGETSPLAQAVEAVSNSRLSRGLERVLLETLSEPGVNPEAGAWWVRRFVARHAWGQRLALYDLDIDHPVGRRAFVVFIQEIAAHDQLPLLKRLIKREKARLRTQVELWSVIGSAFVQLDEHSAALKWFSDWRSREGVTAAMLSDLTIALHARKRDSEAIGVSRLALELPPDQSTPNHQLWIAFEEALAGRVELASALLEETSAARLEPYFKSLRALVVAVLAVHAAPPAQRKKAFKSQRMKFRHPEIRNDLSIGSLKPSTVRALKEMARLSREGYNPFWVGAIGQTGQKKGGRGQLTSYAVLFGGWLLLLVILAIGVKTCSSLPVTPETAPPLPELDLKPPVPLGSDNTQPLVVPTIGPKRSDEDRVGSPFEISPAQPERILPDPNLPPPIAIPPPPK